MKNSFKGTVRSDNMATRLKKWHFPEFLRCILFAIDSRKGLNLGLPLV